MQFNRGRELKKTKVEIIPMIDTMFFLLVFFILSSVGVIKLQGLNINLPKEQQNTSKEPPPPPKELTIAIDKNKVITVNRQSVGRGGDIRPLLRNEILKQYGASPDMTTVSVVISAEPSVPHGIVVRCIDQARALDISKFAIATTAESGADTTSSTAPGSPAAATSKP